MANNGNSPTPTAADREAAKRYSFNLAVQRSRLIVYSLSLLVGLAAWSTGGSHLDFWPAVIFIALANLTAALGMLIHRIDYRRGWDRDWAPVWMGLDVVYVSLAVTVTGGPASHWYLWYFANTAAAAFIRGLGAAVVIMIANSACYLGLMVYYQAHAQPVDWADVGVRLLLLNGASIFAVVAIASGQKRRRKVKELLKLDRERLAELEKLSRRLEAKTVQLDTVTATAPVGLGLVVEGEVAWANGELARLLGLAGTDLSGRIWSELAPEINSNSAEELSACYLSMGPGQSRHCLFRAVDLEADHPETGRLVSLVDITPRQRAEDALRLSEERYRAIFDGSAEGLLVLDPVITDLNTKAATILGIDLDRARGRGLPDFAPDRQPDGRPSREVLAAKLAQARAGESPFFYWQAATPDGDLVDTEMWLRGLAGDRPGRPVLAGMRDVTDSLKLSAELARSQAEYRKLYRTARRDEQLIKSLLAVSGDPIMIFDAQGRCRFVNEAFGSIFGWSAEEINDGRAEFVPADEQGLEERIRHDLAAGRAVVGLETVRLSQRGSEIPVSISAASVSDPQTGHPADALFILRDISAQRQAANALRQAYELQKDLADRDGLTGLLNHRRIQEELDMEVGRARRQGGLFTIILLDLDDFKRLNDSHGHPFGDRALTRVADALRRQCRASDVIGRYGGDEFLVVLPGAGPKGAYHLAERIAQDLAANPLTTGDGQSVLVKCSMGLATFPFDAAAKLDLINLADQAMYTSKSAPADYAITAAPLGEQAADWDAGPAGLDALIDILDRRDGRTGDYRRAARTAADELGRAVGLAGPDLENLLRAVDIHHLGYLYVPEAIRFKTGLLPDEERELIRAHPSYLKGLLGGLEELEQSVLETAELHHERWDGRGYPHGLAGEDIPLAARVLAVASTAAELSLDRRSDYIGRELSLLAGSELDPDLVKAYLDRHPDWSSDDDN